MADEKKAPKKRTPKKKAEPKTAATKKADGPIELPADPRRPYGSVKIRLRVGRAEAARLIGDCGFRKELDLGKEVVVYGDGIAAGKYQATR